ncbi:MAG: flagellar hook assembly protein FlgD [Parvibaculum sp.]|nr:flagellar hook assembly protein FlgD [Parvibaculum sp.]
MSVDAIAAAQAAQTASAAKSAADVASSKLSSNYSMFLTLLTTQLKNQDPTDPMKSAEFTQQLVQYSSVEQQIQTNKNLESLLSANIFQAANTAVGLIGKEVESYSNGSSLKNGEAKWTISLDDAAANTTVQVLDKNGATVFSEKITGTKGDQAYTWDGKDTSGNTMADGSYFLQVAANDASGQAVKSYIRTKGVVTSVDITSSNPVITVNGSQILYSDVTSVTNPGSGS